MKTCPVLDVHSKNSRIRFDPEEENKCRRKAPVKMNITGTQSLCKLGSEWDSNPMKVLLLRQRRPNSIELLSTH